MVIARYLQIYVQYIKNKSGLKHAISITEVGKYVDCVQLVLCLQNDVFILTTNACFVILYAGVCVCMCK